MSIKGIAFTEPDTDALKLFSVAVTLIGPAATPVASPGLAAPVVSMVAACVLVCPPVAEFKEVMVQLAVLETSCVEPLFRVRVAVNCCVCSTRNEGVAGLIASEIGVGVGGETGVVGGDSALDALPPPQPVDNSEQIRKPAIASGDRHFARSALGMPPSYNPRSARKFRLALRSAEGLAPGSYLKFPTRSYCWSRLPSSGGFSAPDQAF